MAYKYLPSFLSIAPSSPSGYIRSSFEQSISELFSISSELYTIEEETAFASGLYQDVDVRITKAVDSSTGLKLGDDHKMIFFKSLDHSVKLGRLYKFDNNYWITINTRALKTLNVFAVVKRCNNMLRWIDNEGGYYSIPCSLNYRIDSNKDYNTSKSALVQPAGTLDCISQFNAYSNKIRPNQRFLFGNSSSWEAYKVVGAGLGNFDNQETEDNMSSGLLRLTMYVDYVNKDEDDLVNGIANVYANTYTLEIDQDSISGSIGEDFQASATIKKDGSIVSGNVVWSTSDASIASVDSDGLVTLIENGTVSLTCSLENNSSISDSINVQVTDTPVDIYEIAISPENNTILEDETISYSVYLKKNGVVQADIFTFNIVDTGVPTDNYDFATIDGNSFYVQNFERYFDSSLRISCVSGIHNKNFDIYLSGAW